MEMEERLMQVQFELSLIKNMLEEVLEFQKAHTKDTVMDVNELSDFLNLDKNIIYAKVGNNELPFFKVGKRFKFRKSEITAWLKEQKAVSEMNKDEFVNRYLQRKVLRT